MNSIANWCGRFGNNIQQISNAIFYCQENQHKFQCPDSENVKPFSLSYGESFCPQSIYFFHLPSKLGTGASELHFDVERLYKKRRGICRDIIFENLKIDFENINAYEENVVVMHIRSGDIFSRNDHYCSVVSSYIQNPLSYYLKIIEGYDKAIVLTEDYNNPVIFELEKNPKVDIKILGIKETIEIMLSAKNIATSGVSSFGIACALLSKNVEKVYCSSICLDEILNYKDLEKTDIEVEIIEIDQKRYIDWNQWLNSEDQRKLMIDFKL